MTRVLLKSCSFRPLPWILIRSSLSLISGASLFLILVKIRFWAEKALSQSAVWRGNKSVIWASLIRLGSSSLWCVVRSCHNSFIILIHWVVEGPNNSLGSSPLCPHFRLAHHRGKVLVLVDLQQSTHRKRQF